MTAADDFVAPSLFIIDGILDRDLMEDDGASLDCLGLMFDWTSRLANVDAPATWFNGDFNAPTTEAERGEMLFSILEAHEIFE
jgi:hypothetical protein